MKGESKLKMIWVPGRMGMEQRRENLDLPLGRYKKEISSLSQK